MEFMGDAMGGFSTAHWLTQTWGSIRLDPNQELPESWSGGSGKKFAFICSCGRIFNSAFYSIKHSNSCGKCSFKPKEYWLAQNWGDLTLNPDQNLLDEWGVGSGKCYEFICSCGRLLSSSFYTVTSGHTSSCGKCTFLSKGHWLEQHWGKLKLVPHQDLPDEWGPSSNKRMLFQCTCGQTTKTAFQNVVNHSKSCGHCNDNPKEYWLDQKWGELKLDPEQKLRHSWAGGATYKLRFICTCGRDVVTCFHNVTSGRSVTCNKCNFKSKDYWLAQTWGELKLDPNQELPDEWAPWTEKDFTFLCSCKRVIKKKFGHIYSENFQSCGMCTWKPKEYWLAQTWGKLKLDPSQVFPQTEWGVGLTPKLRFICDCGKIKRLMLAPVIRGYTQSCGCLKPGVSDLSPAYKVYEVIAQLAADAEFSYWFKKSNGNRTEYDIYIPSKHLAIEYHGLIWHSEKYLTGARDHEKFLISQKRGDRLIQIYSDEWRDKQEIMKAQLQEILAPQKKTRIKPIFTLHTQTPPEARTFLDQHHYLGAASGCLTVIAKDKDQIVGVWIFMKREEGVILWHRACWHHAYKAWNPHSTALHLALPELKKMGFNKMITFSDNRFHTGQLYEKLGFTFEKNIRADYGYTNGTKRVSKYNLRVKAGVNEKAEAKAKGWYRIWDSGKRRFSLSIPRCVYPSP
jgi:hypothetical protein